MGASSHHVKVSAPLQGHPCVQRLRDRSRLSHLLSVTRSKSATTHQAANRQAVNSQSALVFLTAWVDLCMCGLLWVVLQGSGSAHPGPDAAGLLTSTPGCTGPSDSISSTIFSLGGKVNLLAVEVPSRRSHPA